MTDDTQLLRQFAEENSQAAFAELAERHAGWVFRAALRRTGDRADVAQEVVQQVFLSLARHASSLVSHPSVLGWLNTTARYAANHVMRAEARRKRHEEAAARELAAGDETGPDWTAIRPLLDQALDRLPRRDSEAIVQHYFAGRSVPEIAAALGISSHGARKRVERALEKLRLVLARRGIASTGAALGSMLAAHAGGAAPAAVQAIAASAALQGVAAAQPLLALGMLHFMSTSKSLLIAGAIGLAAVSSSFLVALREVRATAAYSASAHPSPGPASQGAGPEHRPAFPDAEPAAPEKATTQLASADLRPRDAGQDFLRRFPAARDYLKEHFRAQVSRNHALFYEMAGLTAPQIARFEQRLIDARLATLAVSPGGINFDTVSLPPAELSAIFGADGLRHWRRFERAAAANHFARELGLAVAKGAEPLTVAQMLAVLENLARHSREFREGGAVNPATLEWTAALREVAHTLTAPQWNAAQPWMQKTYVDSELKTLAATAP